MDTDRFIDQAWTAHTGDAAGVADRLADGALALPATEAQAARLALLAHHVFGEHLGEWRRGLDFFSRLGTHPACTGTAAEAARRCVASLRLCAGEPDPQDACGVAQPGGSHPLGTARREQAPPVVLAASDHIRVQAMAAGNLAAHDAARARALLTAAVAQAEHTALADADPANRTLAASANGIAATLEDKPERTPAERALMILAAQTARRYWALAGTWLEAERAEYRLAMTWLQAGDLPAARHHALQCQQIVQAHDGPALERFFACEALGCVERAAGHSAGHKQALAAAREAFAKLDEADQGWCRPSLDKLGG